MSEKKFRKSVNMLKYTDEYLLRLITEKFDETGNIPKQKEFEISRDTYIKRFGSWHNALKLAISDEVLIQKIKEDIENYGKIIVYNKYKHLSKTRFSLWSNVINILKLECIKYKKPNKYNKEELIKNLQEKAKELNRVPKYKDMVNPSGMVYSYHLETWNNALKLAGLKNKFPNEFSNEELLEILKNIKKTTGKAPKFRKCKPYAHIIVKKFGSWENALKLIGCQSKTRFDKDELILILQNKAKELGRTPTYSDMKIPHYATYQNRFGSWNNALLEAGILFNKKGRPKKEILKEDSLEERLFGKWKGVNKN